MRRAQAGDADAYGDLVGRHRSAALRVAAVVLGGADGADDVVQQATERAWRSMATFDATRPFRPWFLRIAANSARNDRRTRGRRANLEVRAATATAVSATVTPEEAAVSDADRQQVVEALNRLEADDRLVIAV